VARARTPGPSVGETPGAGAGVRNDRAHLSSHEGLIHPSRTGSSVVVRAPNCRLKSGARWTRGKQQPWKRKFADRDFRPLAPPMGHADGRKDSTDRLMPPQAAGMSCYSVAEEITSICADYLVELRGFEPMANAGTVRSRAIRLFASHCAQSARGLRLRSRSKHAPRGSLSGAAHWRRRARLAVRRLDVAAGDAANTLLMNVACRLRVSPGVIRRGVRTPIGAATR